MPLYVWHDKKSRSIVTSGLRFSDFLFLLHEERGLIVLRYGEGGKVQEKGEFRVIQPCSLVSFALEDIYSWGDFYWVDFEGATQPELNDLDRLELREFAVNALPKRSAHVSSLSNKFLVAAHDDGWYARVFYTRWSSILELISARAPALSSKHLSSLEIGECGFWIDGNDVYEESIMTFDVDVLIRKYAKDR